MVYLDNAATTYPKPKAVLDTLFELHRKLAINAGRGSYKSARQASQLIEETRHKMAVYTGADRDSDVIFTASDTMAANIVLQGLELAKNAVVYVSPYEHNAIMRTLHARQQSVSFTIRILPTKEEDGSIDMGRLSEFFALEPPDVICITQVSNVTGYVLPYVSIFALAKTYDAITVLDSAQGLGLIPVHMRRDQIDFLLFAGHKNLYGTFGIGGFINGSKRILKPLIFGGNGSESLNLGIPEQGITRYEMGSQNLPAIGSLSTALDLVTENHAKYLNHERELVLYLRQQLEKIPEVILFPHILPKEFTGIVSFACRRFDYPSETIGAILDEDFDIAVRTGYHCAPLAHDVIDSKKYGGTVRVSVGQFNTKEDVDALVSAVWELMEE